jgi:hypothetical protein
MDGLTWGQYQNDPATFMSDITRVVSAANANGIYVIWEFGSANPNQDMPTDLSGDFGNWWPYWWNDQTYNGNQASLQGLPIWQAWFKGFIQPVMSAVDSQPCTLGYKFANEPQGFPSSDSLGFLSSFFASMGSQTRAAGFVKDLVYTGPGSHPGTAGLIDEIQAQMSSGSFRPAIYEVHYAETDPASFANDGQSAPGHGVAVWDGEEAPSFFTQANVQNLMSLNASSTVFRWDEDGNLLASGTGTTPGTVTQTATDLSALETQVLGNAQFYV